MRFSIALLTIPLTLIGSSNTQACCFKNWLYGRPATPYVVGYAPVATPVVPAPVPCAPAPAPCAPAAAPCAPCTTGTAVPYAAGYPSASTTTYAPVGVASTTTSALQPTAATTAPVLSSGAYQAQRPGYYDNPSVYTGRPVPAAYAASPVPVAGPVPVASYYRGGAQASTNLSATNVYPDTYRTAYVSGYRAAQVPVTSAPAPGLPLAVATPSGAPATALPTTQVAPVYAPTPASPSGFSRFCGSCFGTKYRTSYYRAPVTYYRPATTVDPVSGTTVTVQQPCTSYAQQVQRTPYSGVQAPSTRYVQPAPAYSQPSCGSGCSSAPVAGTYPPAVNGAVGQASATAPAALGQSTIPIPSTLGPGANTAPLTGAPNGQPAAPQSSSDMAPLNQPELRNRPSTNGTGANQNTNSNESTSPKAGSSWQLQHPADSVAMIRPPRIERGTAEPILAPEDYQSPFRRQIGQQASPVQGQTFEAPALPSRSRDSVNQSYESNFVSAPIREASSTGPRTYHRSARPIQRDTTWKPARN